MDSVQIINEAELKRLHRYQRYWYVGWVFALIASAGTVYLAGEISAYKTSMAALEAQAHDLHDIQETEKSLVDRFEEAWQHNDQIAETLMSFGEYFRERQAIKQLNAQNHPYPRPSWAKPVTLTPIQIAPTPNVEKEKGTNVTVP
jgi:cytochrome c-type biogenesis protein CcmH/NrfG